jgi:hypothetical protein
MSVGIDVQGVDAVVAALGKMTDKQARAMLQKSASAGARALKPYVKRAAPKGQTGNLRRSIRVGRTKRQRPGAYVSPKPSIAFYRHMVIGGTRPHGPKTAKVMIFRPAGEAHNVTARWVRGTKPRPFVSQGFDAGRVAAEAAIDKVVDAALAKL